ncbi:MAG TPA: ABC transporter permease [Halanaerobiales bacterium]|nr:ABC transporter permease [Halanaerobiales bacterium]
MFKEIFIANVKEYIRDKATIFWFLIFPLIFVFIFGWVFSGGNEMYFNIGIINESGSEIVHYMIEGINSVDSFNVFLAEEREAGADELEALRSGDRHLVMEFPELDFQKVFSEGETLKIPVYYDASKQQINQVLLSVINQFFNEAESRITGAPKIFELQQQPVQSEKLTDFDFILPGILAMALMQLGLFGSLQSLYLREKKIIRGLGVTPLNRGTLLGSELLLRLILGFIQTGIIIFTGKVVFGITIVSHLVKVFGLVILGSATFISLGYFLISFVSTSEAGNGLMQVVQFPMMFLSGTFFPYEMMPSYIQPIVKFLPLTYLADGLREVMSGIRSSYSLQTDILVLSSWLVITLLLSIKFWKWE